MTDALLDSATRDQRRSTSADDDVVLLDGAGHPIGVAPKRQVKYATNELRTMLAKVDESLTENFIQTEIPVEFREAYERRFAEGKDDTLEGKILSVADKIDLMYESFGEIQKGNPEPVYMDIYRSSLKAIMKFNDMASVQYFLKMILPELLKDNANTNAQNHLAIMTTQIIQQ